MKETKFTIEGNPGQGNTYEEKNFEHIENYLHEPKVFYGTNRSRIDSYFCRLREEIKNHTTREIIDDLVEYKTKLDGRKGLEEKLEDGGFDRSDIDWALRKKEQYYKKAIKYECYPSAQEINLLLFADIKSKFDRYVYPLIKEGTVVTIVMQRTHEAIVEPLMKMLNENGEHDEDLRYTTDHIYGMIYYLTGMCHLNWTDYDHLQSSL